MFSPRGYTMDHIYQQLMLVLNTQTQVRGPPPPQRPIRAEERHEVQTLSPSVSRCAKSPRNIDYTGRKVSPKQNGQDLKIAYTFTQNSKLFQK